MSFVTVDGINVATTTINRDGIAEQMELSNIGDPITGNAVSVTPAGTSGATAAAVQGIAGGVAVPVTQFAANANLSQVPVATSSEQLLAANPARKGLIIFN